MLDRCIRFSRIPKFNQTILSTGNEIERLGVIEIDVAYPVFVSHLGTCRWPVGVLCVSVVIRGDWVEVAYVINTYTYIYT